jgi:vitamin B12 transporter
MLPLFKFSGFLCLIFCLVFSSNALAENAQQQELNPVVVTATRTSQTADETLASVTVITRDDIERSQSQDLFEVLRTQAGVDVARTGNAGGDISLFLRGTNSNHTLTLIDGVRVSSAATGKFSLTAIDVSQIERIEIVRGPRASLYGSDAIGGVIQIFTRQSTGVRVRAEGGSFGTKKLDFGLGGGDKIKYSLNASLKDIDGYSATNENNVFSFNPDKDSFKAKNISFSLKSPITSCWRLPGR